MPQISLYIDEKTFGEIENAAAKEHVSISRWVAEQIRSRLEPSLPADFGNLYGAIDDDTFVEPD